MLILMGVFAVLTAAQTITEEPTGSNEPGVISSSSILELFSELDYLTGLVRDHAVYNAAASGQATACHVIPGSIYELLSPDLRYTFNFAKLQGCGTKTILISGGFAVSVNGKSQTHWERRQISVASIRELLYHQGEGQNLSTQTDASRTVSLGTATPLAFITLPPFFAKLIKEIIGVSSFVCQAYGYSKESCDLVQTALTVLDHWAIKEAHDKVFVSKESVLPTLFFANAHRYHLSAETMERFIETVSVLQDDSHYSPVERLFVLFTQTQLANREANVGEAMYHTILELK